MLKLHPHVLLLTLTITACAGSTSVPSDDLSVSAPSSFDTIASGDYSQVAGDILIHLDGDEVTFSSQPAWVTVQNNIIGINGSGVYVLSGETAHLRIHVDAPAQNVRLILNGLSMTSDINAPIYVKSVNKITLDLVPGSTNYLEDAPAETFTYEEGTAYPKGTVYSRDDMEIEGHGSLFIKANFNNGIHSNNDLRIQGNETSYPKLIIDAKNNAIKGNDSVEIQFASIAIASQGDAIESDTSDKPNKGYVRIEHGYLDIECLGDGIIGYRSVAILGGTISIKTGAGASVSTTPTSRNGLKSQMLIAVSGGQINLNTQDHGLNSNQDVAISGGTLTIRSSEDGVHAEEEFTISGGILDISQCYEGIQAYALVFDGGITTITSSDDGINAAEGDLGTTITTHPAVTINNGTLYINALGDGLDSNGDILMNGGLVLIHGPLLNENGPMDMGDRGYTYAQNGGIIVAVGSSGMSIGPNDGTQYSALIRHTAAVVSGTRYVITDQDDQPLYAFDTIRTSYSLLIASPLFEDGTYKLYAGGTVSADALMYGPLSEQGSYTVGTLIHTWAFSPSMVHYVYGVATGPGGGGPPPPPRRG